MSERPYEDMLKECVERYDSLVHYLPDGVMVYTDFKIVFANAASLKLLGASREDELLGTSIFEYIQTPDWPDANRRIEQMIDSGKPSSVFDRQLLRLDGKKIVVEVRASPIAYRGMPSIQILLRDLSERMRMKEILHERDSLYKTLMESVVAGVFVEQDKKIVYANPCLLDMFGYRAEEMIGRSLDQFVSVTDNETLQQVEGYAHDEGQKPFFFQLSGRQRDGSPIYLEGNGTFIIFNGKEALLGTVQDVTIKFEQEQQLLNSSILYQHMMMLIPEPIVISHQGEVLFMNQHAMDLFEVTSDIDMIGKNMFDYLPKRDHESVQADIEQTMSEHGSIPTPYKERMITLSNNNTLHVEISNIRIDNYKGKNVMLSVIRDLTERKRSEEQMLRTEKLSVVGQLAAGVAHEIRNPLTALKGFTQLLQAKYKDESGYFQIMSGEIDRINLIVNEFMTLAKPHFMPFQNASLEAVLQSVISILDTQAILLNVEIEFQQFGPLPNINCNENQLKQVFMNVIKNALEAMPQGGKVFISASTETLAGREQVRIQIKDGGAGIPEDIIRRLGEPFITTKEKGTGLGLMISSRIIEAHNGTLHIESVQDEGTTIDIRLPID